MRTEAEVRNLLAIYKKHNDAFAEELKSLTGDDFEDVSAMFNRNALIISALQWMIGEDTIRVTTAA